MKTITTFALLILVASMAFGGMTSNVSAAEDSTILLKIAKRAQEQIDKQISDDSSDKIKRLFEEGRQEVDALEKALKNNDVSSAKEHFLSAMKIFKEISRHLTSSNSVSDATPQAELSSVRDTAKNPSNDLQRLQVYVNSLKTIAKKHDASIDFSELNELFTKARQQISDKEFTQALDTLHEIKETIVDVNKELREKASKQESQRANEYAQKYLEQLDRLIENAKKQGVSDEIIQKLVSARENLSSTDDPRQIIEEIRKIMSLKDQFDLTKHDRLESRILQVEKTLSRLSHVDGIDQDDISNASDLLETIKEKLNAGEFETANELLRDLAKQLAEIKNSL
jgi:flagellin-specific chaperone FliS